MYKDLLNMCASWDGSLTKRLHGMNISIRNWFFSDNEYKESKKKRKKLYYISAKGINQKGRTLGGVVVGVE